VVFIIGLISAAYSSADSALTALTTSFSIDILGLPKKYGHDENLLKKKRYYVHFLMAVIIIFAIISFRIINNQAVIAQLFTFAGYTYGPLLGLYAFGMFTGYKVHDRLVPLVAVLSPVISYFFGEYAGHIFPGYQVGFELLIVNGALTFLGLFFIKKLKTT
jgi:Na+/proline symporter